MDKDNNPINKNVKDVWRTSCFVVDTPNALTLNRVRAGRSSELLFLFIIIIISCFKSDAGHEAHAD